MTAPVPRLSGVMLAGLGAVMLAGAHVAAAGAPGASPSLLGLPQLPVPPDNPMTPAKIDLGRKLFMDRRLSHNNTISCAMCHVPAYVIDRIRSLPDYDRLFEGAFNGRGPTVETIGQAIASYERTLISGNSRFDRWYYGGEQDALNAQEQRGFLIFSGKGRCIACHAVGEESALFSDDRGAAAPPAPAHH